MKQYEAVIAAMEKMGGIATLGHLYQEVFKIENCDWHTKTPFASVRRIVQENKSIYKIKPGLYALVKYRDKFEALNIVPHIDEKPETEEFNHSYYQGLLLEIGNMKKMETYVPAQDKNRIFIGKKLGDIATTTEMKNFSYPALVNRAKSIDVIWFNGRGMLSSVFEVEHSTDIQNSLLKFCDLQDFYTGFYIVASEKRKEEFLKKLSFSAFSEIKNRVRFMDYENVADLHTKLSELISVSQILI